MKSIALGTAICLSTLPVLAAERDFSSDIKPLPEAWLAQSYDFKAHPFPALPADNPVVKEGAEPLCLAKRFPAKSHAYVMWYCTDGYTAFESRGVTGIYGNDSNGDNWYRAAPGVLWGPTVHEVPGLPMDD